MNKHSLYRIFDESNKLIYIGISDKLLDRVRSHTKKKDWSGQIHKITIEYFNTRLESEEAERLGIINEKPAYNIMHNAKYLSRDNVVERKKRQRLAFSKALGDYISEQQKTWFDAAYEIGVCHTVISRWKNGKMCPNKAKFERIEEWSKGVIKKEDFELSAFNLLEQ